MNHKAYLALAIPLIFSTITTPLLGAVDTAVVGQMQDPSYIAAVAVGTIIFNTMYWLFGFLRVSTSGFAAQAQGAKDAEGGMLAIARPFLIAVIAGTSLIALQLPIMQVFLPLLSPDHHVQSLADDYLQIRIWGAPFALLNYVILGWLMGMSMIKISLLLQVLMNLMNIVLDILFVFGFSWGVSGVAAATLLSEITAFAIGLAVVLKASPFKGTFPSFHKVIDPSSFKKMMKVNRDLFIRTVCLLTVFNLFTAKGASFGTETLAANAILLQIHYIMAYFYDGFANASSIMTGKAIGSKDKTLYQQTLKLSMQWAIYSSVMIASVYYLLNDYILRLFTNIPRIVETAQSYEIWIIVFPLTISFGIILYGVFTGATEAAPIRDSMLIALSIFLLVYFLVVPIAGNHGLWLSFLIFSAGRSVFLSMFVPRLTRKLFPETGPFKNEENKTLESSLL
ncbi:MATE family efflux transporter [Aeromicrobium ponti]|uniref:MATE family multidrug resistance protein n=1 Tax=Cytobacillus oceanisediminis TaxID=665099 RepID=A0A562JIS6_9BACI|nr:MATE family efflux transporter [Cytobacillus oceanisediminis]TWH83092.1 MATE family multidrug resistance protein [Cytobacillus oceanisediminis]